MLNDFNGKMTGGKAFVCIMPAKGDMWQTICCGGTVCASHNDIKQIQALADKFMAGIGDVTAVANHEFTTAA